MQEIGKLKEIPGGGVMIKSTEGGSLYILNIGVLGYNFFL